MADPVFSVVVPTRNEGPNLTPLVERVSAALAGEKWEMILVDDSDDPAALQALASATAVRACVRFEHRKRGDGLAGAVIRGFSQARGSFVAVLDADLQHPPEVLPSLLARLRAGADLVVASRFVAGGADAGLTTWRRLVSSTARGLIRFSLRRTRTLTDPTSGCFAFRRSCLGSTSLKAIGWKVLLEVLVRCRPRLIEEVPIQFALRTAGRSKFSYRQVIGLLRQIWDLARQDPGDRRMYVFALVGLSGVLINMVIFFLARRADISVEASALLSASLALVSNFFFHDRFTWPDRVTGSSIGRGLRAVVIQAAGIGLDVVVVGASHGFVRVPAAVANLFGIGAGAVWNYTGLSHWVWRENAGEAIEQAAPAPRRSPGLTGHSAHPSRQGASLR